jgi:hypothetical protein
MFQTTSRYYNLLTLQFTGPAGVQVAYKSRRLLPPGDALALLQEVTVTEGDRLDLIAARTLGDPEQFWRVCDANNAMSPFDLTAAIGRVLRVPVPQF